MERQVLQGRHALVTGGAQGIGYAIALALLEQGATVTLAGRTPATLETAVLALRAQAPAAQLGWVLLDVSDATSVATGVAQAVALAGPVAILINNAGQAESAAFEKTTAALWQNMLDVNLTGSFHCTQAVLPGMVAAAWGRIVNVVSTAGLRAYPYVAAYCAAKHGVIGLTRALALEVATRGVTVNAVCPGYTETPLLQKTVANIMHKTGRQQAETQALLAAANPQQRLVQAEEVAHAVAWLCQPAAAAMNGQAIAVAGGEVM
ncbi:MULTISPECIES: SDR family NAD(P)-dependent oxidoreductase [unclassified Undibacterium]|uniref:SDR family NAD(P)-dependent oxidoreductase n=1 Tax=unclassified Undibacterium TaxID=2630295 RepID=UPI002AC9C245|nr:MULTISPECIES: SDR family NAD(P)-dependent oxidoreductase [unclassified Undibacterium]MEB0138688.1 SDR family NAD(P)-dependent oxidoreductase [Undibacterium sp. CCC2.1]MEB0171489.1 SDR family NAD(P)-dependent oxidoreductase [Undibacterium sp. CCC1.1]MEB0175440.1 SDR family NAD(P)-dependent oxidoreductase [Undibacterium sp. CCC3.4]MEB0214689.1 SDR family NAD(P)-dependent oxidoreductase [Undibacterium sp. 5I2]WPX43350.1 SDR family NAD(P)-dependent oxidoreductase [Undibacterium sp. CCC3.4]